MNNDSPNVLYTGPCRESIYETVVSDISMFYSLDRDKFTISNLSFVKCINCLRYQSISFIRDNLMVFAKTIVKTPSGLRKTIVLSDADYLSAESQAALRRSIETNNHTTRFIITTKRFNWIQDPILSRFKTVNVRSNVQRLKVPKCVESVSISDASQLIKDIELHISNGNCYGLQDGELTDESSYNIPILAGRCRSDHLISLYAVLTKHRYRKTSCA